MLLLLLFVMRHVQERFGDFALIGASIAFTLAHQTIWPFWTTPENSIDLVYYLPTFMFGMLTALLAGHTASTRVLWAAVIGIFAATILVTPAARYILLDLATSRYLMTWQLLFGASFAVLLWCVIGRPRIARIFDVAPLRFAGRVSYPTYLFHWLVLVWATGNGIKSSWLAVIALVAASYAVGWVIHVLIEQPLQQVARGRAPELAPASA